MRKYLLAIVGLVLLCLLAALGTASGAPGTFTVNTTDDTDDTTCDGTHCSLREAINAANSNPGSTIEFSIPATDTGYEVSGITGTWTISLTSSLPILSGGGTVISGTTQAANQGDLNPDGPEIEISGAILSGAHCLVIQSADNVVHGLVINRCPLIGVLIQTTGADYNTVSGNYIGTDASGSTKLGNRVGVGILTRAQGNVVGGDTPEERNVISGNDQYGVSIVFSGTMSNTVSGNYIGTDAMGAQDLGNATTGVVIYGGAQNNTVGGDTEGERNIISGNGVRGVGIEGSGTTNNTISGNFIGTVVSGTQALGNGHGVGISYSAQYNTVGGHTEGERNVISGNHIGVSINGSGTMSNTVSGNYIGTDASGSSDLGNTSIGVRIGGGAQNNTVGGQTAGERNVISENNFYGVLIGGSETDGNRVSGNYIGTDAGGTQELGNTYDGVMIQEGAQNNTVGGQTAGERNVISASTWSGVHIKGDDTDGNTVSQNYIGTDVTGTQDLGNTWHGVLIEQGAQNNTVGPHNLIAHNDRRGVYVDDSGTTGNTITQNSIHSNGWLGIYLFDGGNDMLPAPVISSTTCASAVGSTLITTTVELFTGPDDEGKTYLATVSPDGSGNWSASGIVAGDTYLTATATDVNGNTSEFSGTIPGCDRRTYVPLALKRY
jgi:CSLREA domain-containing protein